MGGIKYPASKRDTKFKTSPHITIFHHQTGKIALLITCTVLLGFCIWTGQGLLPHNIFPLRLSGPHDLEPGTQNTITIPELETILQNEPTASKISEWSHHYTTTTYLPGEGKDQGLWTKDKWEEFGIPETWITEHDVTVGDPLLQSLSLITTFTNSTPKVSFEAGLTEDIPPEDPSTTRTTPYIYSSASGNVTAQFIYANFGFASDYDDLEEAKVDVKGKIAIVKYGRGFRQVKVEEAVKRGVVGVVLYTDPGEDGNITESRGYKAYPDGPSRPFSYIERGTADARNLHLRGSHPAVAGKSVPALSASSKDIIPILTALNGHGPKAGDISENWLGGDLEFRGVQYYAGPSQAGVFLNLNNQINYRGAKAYNVLGMIKGTIMTDDQDVIVIGNHRDAWSVGVTDPHSGSAALMGVVRSFGVALRTGWKPQKTIVFVSWDAAEVGLVGSKAWIAENLPWLSDRAIAYLNVVVAAAGSQFRAKASPLLYQVLQDATKVVKSPLQNPDGRTKTVFDEWGGDMIGPGGGDAVPFLQRACIPTTDIGFFPGEGDAPFPYHSDFDTQAWMTTCDPEWKYHLSIVKIWSQMVLRLSENPVLELSAVDYARQLRKFVEVAKEKVPTGIDFDLKPLEQAVADFHTASSILDDYASTLRGSEAYKDEKLWQEIGRLNSKYKNIERQFCYQETKDGENQSEHVIFGASTFYETWNIMPRLFQSLKSGNWSDAVKWRDIIQDRIERATVVIQL